MVHDLRVVAPAFVAMAHRIVWCTAATVTPGGLPATRVLHPIWEWDGSELLGWIATSPSSPKAADLATMPAMSLTYWSPDQDTATADCAVLWEREPEQLEAGWRRFADAPDPVGYDPSIVPGWESAASPAFGILRLTPRRLRVVPGSVLAGGGRTVLNWRRPLLSGGDPACWMHRSGNDPVI